MSLFQRHLADEHVKLGGARWATELESSRLEHLLTCSFPWNVTHVAWEKVPNTVSLDWGAASDAKAAAFVRSLAISRQLEVTVLFSKSHALRVSSFWFAAHLVEAACNAAQYFAIGGTLEKPDLSAIAEFELGSTIWGHAV